MTQPPVMDSFARGEADPRVAGSLVERLAAATGASEMRRTMGRLAWVALGLMMAGCASYPAWTNYRRAQSRVVYKPDQAADAVVVDVEMYGTAQQMPCCELLRVQKAGTGLAYDAEPTRHSMGCLSRTADGKSHHDDCTCLPTCYCWQRAASLGLGRSPLADRAGFGRLGRAKVAR